jgi:hypothetical protein
LHLRKSSQSILSTQGHAIALVVSRWLPTTVAWVRIQGLWWTKQHWGRFSPSTSVSPANHPTNFSIIITWGWHNRPISGRSAEWTQLDSTPHYTNLRKHPNLWKSNIFMIFFNCCAICSKQFRTNILCITCFTYS